MPITIDSREPKTIEYEIKQLGIPIKRKYLKSADYTWGEIGIERKTVTDFYRTLYEGRLYTQLFNLKNNFEQPKLAIIGEIPPTTKWVRIKRKRRIEISLTKEEKDTKEKTMINNWAIIGKSLPTVSILRFDNNKQFIMYLKALFLQTGKKSRGLKPVKKKSSSIEEIMSDILSCIPGWGRKTSDRIAKEYHSINALMCDTLTNLKKKKLNKTQIKNLNRVIMGTNDEKNNAVS